jgi:NADH-quinone oxidoreductase subunit K
MFTITLTHYLILSAVLFAIGVAGVLVRRNALIILMSVELMLNAANLALLGFARQMGDTAGHGLAIFVMTVAAAEAGVGLALVLAIFRHRKTVNVDEIRELRG